jgi:hypothetical protein
MKMSNNQKQDPFEEFFESVGNDIGDAFNSVTKDVSNILADRREHKLLHPYELSILDRLSILFFKIYKYKLCFKNNILRKTVNTLIFIPKVFILSSNIFIPLQVLKPYIFKIYFNHVSIYTPVEYILNRYDIITFGLSTLLFIACTIKSKNSHKKIYMDKISKSAFNEHLEFNNYTTDHTKYQENKIIGLLDNRVYNKILCFNYTNTKEFLLNNIKDLLKIINTKIDKFYMEGDTLIIETNKLKVTPIKKVTHKNANDISEKLKIIFNDLNISISITKTIVNDYADIVYFNTNELYNKITSLTEELQHRLKIKTLELITSDLKEYDYMLKIIKPVTSISFLNYYNSIADKLKNYIIPFIHGIAPDGQVHITDYVSKYHTLVGGATGSGKSKFTQSLLSCLLLSRKNISIFILDIKRNFHMYKNINNVFYSDEKNEIIKCIDFLINLMNQRNKLFTSKEFCENLEDYNKTEKTKLPYCFVLIEEVAELLDRFKPADKKEIETKLQSLTQLGRSAGFRIIISTQKPTKDAINTTIKANLYNRICFQVVDKTQSRVILDNNSGADLDTVGQYIFKSGSNQEIFGALYMNDVEHRKIISTIKENQKLDLKSVNE